MLARALSCPVDENREDNGVIVRYRGTIIIGEGETKLMKVR